jgi:hypothetical protein
MITIDYWVLLGAAALVTAIAQLVWAIRRRR